MKEHIWRLAGFGSAGLVLGAILSHPLAGLAAGLAGYCFLLIRDSRRLYEWLNRLHDEAAPQLHGYHGDIVRKIENLRRYHRQREDRLSQFVKRIQKATAALPDAILILDNDDRIEWANQQAAEYLGIKWPQDKGQRLANLIRHPHLLAYLKEQRQSGDIKGVTLPSPEADDLQIEYRVILYGDDLRLLIARDVTQVQQINQMRRDFIANASHELRTPLTVIAGYLESMDGDMDSSSADMQPLFRQMRNQANRMQTLIEDLLMLSTLESDSDEHESEPVAVADIMSSIYKEATTLSGEQKHIFVLDIDDDLLIRGNHNELYSAFSNLVVNAVQYTPAGGMIRIRWYEDELGAHLKVSDTGEGIAPGHIPRLTERFYRVDKDRSRESGGTGLGLAIVKHVMQRHRGGLYIDSELGKGSIFRCDFPSELAQRHGGDADSQQQLNR